MKKTLLISALLISQFLMAQFSAQDVQFFVGEGTQTAYMVVDFKDGTDDRSYAWGFHFNEGETLRVSDMLMAIESAEPNFSHETGFNGAFLNDIVFNAHNGLAGEPDWWSTWSGNSSDNMSMSGGISEILTNEKWYGASYGFSNPTPEHPAQPIPAYHSLWFTSDDIINWFGDGNNQSIVVVDFGTENEEGFDSFAFGVQYENETISAADLLETLQTQLSGFFYEINEGKITELSWAGFQGLSSETNPWKTYTGTDLSNWTTASDLTSIELSDHEWLGLSFGKRRPITPTDETEKLNNPEVLSPKTFLYPNPTSEQFFLSSNKVLKVEIFDVNGRIVKSIEQPKGGINVQDLAKGIYIVRIQETDRMETRKLIIQ